MAKDKTAGDYAEERATTEPNLHEGGTTTRDDALDQGPPMAEAEEGNPLHFPSGPEDAGTVDPEERANLRGEYNNLVRQPAPHNVSVPIPEDERVEGGPVSHLIDQRTGEVVE